MVLIPPGNWSSLLRASRIGTNLISDLVSSIIKGYLNVPSSSGPQTLIRDVWEGLPMTEVGFANLPLLIFEPDAAPPSVAKTKRKDQCIAYKQTYERIDPYLIFLDASKNSRRFHPEVDHGTALRRIPQQWLQSCDQLREWKYEGNRFHPFAVRKLICLLRLVLMHHSHHEAANWYHTPSVADIGRCVHGGWNFETEQWWVHAREIDNVHGLFSTEKKKPAQVSSIKSVCYLK